MSKANLVCSEAFTFSFNAVASDPDTHVSIAWDPTGTRNGNVDSSAANESSNVDCPQSKFVYEDISFTKFFDDATDVGGAGTITDKTITAGAIVITYTKGDGSQSTYTAYGYFMGSEQVTIEKDQEEVAGVVLTYHISNKQSDGTVTTPVTAAVA